MSTTKKFSIQGVVWLYPGKGGWHFLTLEAKCSNQIQKFVQGDTSAWGSIKVYVTIGKVSWETSLFPDKKSQSYLLPLKLQIRKRLQISAGARVRGVLALKREDLFE